MKKSFIFILTIAFIFVSCEDSKIQESSSFYGWYTDLTKVASTAGFSRINQAIDNNECIYTTGYSHNYDHYATRDLFFSSNGMWSSSSASYGTCRFLPEVGKQIFAIHIINDNTLSQHYAWLYDPNYVPSTAEIAGQVYAGHNFGTLVYYDSQFRFYTYTMLDDKLFVSNGDIYTITSSGLIKDGSSGIMSKYDPSKVF